MIPAVFTRLQGSAIIARHLRAQRSMPFMARDRLEAIRDRRIRDTVSYAARHVPYYREWFVREGIVPSEIRSAADLERLPLLDRELVRSQPLLFATESRRGRGALTFSTSGTTGMPLRLQHDRRSLLANMAYGERERAPTIGICGSFRPREVYVGNETSVMRQMTAFYKNNTFMPVRPRRRFVSVREPIESVAAIVNAERPDVLVGYGGWLDLFFKAVAIRAIDLHLPKMVMYMAEAMPHGGRARIEGEFGVPLLSRYSAAEAFKIGHYCERRTGFHLHEDLCHVRIVDREGRDAAPGEQGEIVVSNLVNRGSVLLNYPIGDLGSLSGETCSCGRTFRLLSELEGRVEDILVLPGGRFVHPRAVWQVFMHDPGVLQYQLTQHEARRFHLSLVTDGEAAFRESLDRALPELEGLLGPGAVIDARRGDELDRPEGKFRAVTSLCAPTAGD